MSILALAVTLVMASALSGPGWRKRAACRLSRGCCINSECRRAAREAAPLAVAAELSVALGLIFVLVPWRRSLDGPRRRLRDLRAHGSSPQRENPMRLFGPHGSAHLGKNQLAALPVWLGAVTLVWLNGPTHSSDWQSASGLAVVALMMATVRGGSSLRAAHEARGDR